MALDNFRTIELIWDKANKSIIKTIKTASSDTTGRYLSVKILDVGQEVTLNDAKLQLYWEHPNFNTSGTDDFNTVNNGGLFKMTFSKEMLTNIGELTAHLVLTLPDGKITSDGFTIEVIKGADDGVVVPTNGSGLVEQVARKIDKGNVTLTDLTQEVKLAMTGGSVPIVGLNSVGTENIKSSAVTPQETNFFKHGKNLYNKDTATQDTSISTFSGNLATNAGHVTSDYIKINPSKTYAISPIPANVRVAFYDNAKENIAGTGLSDPTNPITPPDGAVFLRYSSTNQTGRQLEEGSNPTVFEPYTGYYYDEEYIREGSITPEKLGELGPEVFSDNSLTPKKMTFFKSSKNLYNKATSTPDRSISVASGNLATNVNNTTSDFIPVESGEHYSLSPHSSIIRLAFYDSDKNFISGLSDPANPILVPENGAFVRYSYGGDYEDVRQFEKGQVVTSYEPYYESVFDVETIDDNSIPVRKLKGGATLGGGVSDEILVDMKPTIIEFYMKGSNPDSSRYLKYSFKKEVRAFDDTKSNGNLEAWRLVDLLEVERISGFSFTNVYSESLTTDGVWEFALKEKGQPQFMGGSHGNEVMTDVYMLVDGIQKELGTTEKFTCNNIQFVQKSTIYRVYTQTPLANTVKAYDITAKDGIKITGEFDWIESIVLEGTSYFPMLPIKRTLTDDVTQITDRFVRDSDYDIKDISTTSSVVSSGASEPTTGVTVSNMWGQSSGLSVKITSLKKAREEESMYITASQLYNKFYYQIIGKSDYTVDVGEKMKSTVLFKINTVN